MTQLPWLAMDPSAKVSVAPEDTLWDNAVQYKVVKMSFRPAAPGEPYRLYIDPDTKQLHACAFNATEGEEVVVFGDHEKAEGMVLPRTTWSTTPITHRWLRDVEWMVSGKSFDESRMTRPTAQSSTSQLRHMTDRSDQTDSSTVPR
jgi:hypothetical protein